MINKKLKRLQKNEFLIKKEIAKFGLAPLKG